MRDLLVGLGPFSTFVLVVFTAGASLHILTEFPSDLEDFYVEQYVREYDSEYTKKQHNRRLKIIKYSGWIAFAILAICYLSYIEYDGYLSDERRTEIYKEAYEEGYNVGYRQAFEDLVNGNYNY